MKEMKLKFNSPNFIGAKGKIRNFVLLGLPGGSDGKASACRAGDPRSIPGLGRSPREGNGLPQSTPVLLPGNSMD